MTGANWNRLRTWLLCATMVCALATSARPVFGDDAKADDATTAPSHSQVVLVIGAPGTDEYGAMFRDWAEDWREAAEAGGAQFTLIGGETAAEGVEEQSADGERELATPVDADAEDAEPVADDRILLQEVLAACAEQKGADALWLVLIGHGTFDGDVAKFNLRGPDVSAKELGEWLKPIATPVAIINCASASAPFLPAASGPNRVVIAATKSGFELNFARFGQYLARAIGDVGADLDKDGQTSLLEAYLTACRDVTEFYQNHQRLATEHALLDDNGDGLGTPAAWFRGVRATQRAKDGAALDGLRAHQFHLVRSDSESQLPADARKRRDELELQLAALREKKTELGDDAYYEQLQPLLVELARLYQPAERDDREE